MSPLHRRSPLPCHYLLLCLSYICVITFHLQECMPSNQYVLFVFLPPSVAFAFASPSLMTKASNRCISEAILIEKGPDYPEEEAERLLAALEEKGELKYFLSPEQINKIITDPQINKDNITYKNLCASTKRPIFPKLVKFEEESFFVLNPTSRPLQYYEIEECNLHTTSNTGGEDQPCMMIADGNHDFVTKCVQERITRPIYYMSNDRHRKIKSQSKN